MNEIECLKKLLDERGWSEYRLAKEANLSNSTIANLFHRNNSPSIPTLRAVCKAFGITTSQFFAEDERYELKPDQKDMFDKWKYLNPEQKNLVNEQIKQLYKTDNTP